MLAAGALVDENGVKLDSLDDVNWGQDLQGAIGDLITKLDEFITKITEIPDPVINPQVNWPAPPDYISGGGPDPVNPNNPYEPGYDPGNPPDGHWYPGYVPPRPGGTPFRLGDGGEGEYIIPASLMRGNRGGSNSMSVYISVQATDAKSVRDWLYAGADREIADALLRKFPGAVGVAQ
jgi:hypothetical protein